MDNWKDYIENKFVPKDLFTFTIDECDMTMTVTHKQSGTRFDFYFDGSDWTTLYDVHFSNDNTKGWSGEYQGSIKFSLNEVKIIDNYLSPAFDTGWVSKDIFLFDKHWKSKVYFNLDKTGAPFVYFSSELGCLSLILFPVFWTLGLLFGTTKTVTIYPVKKYL
ncbi:MAG: hypothetical protein KF900_06375 [Bacteroidetes bacterium]|nr:hypothetical protein [Bacteroidota bacterium]